MSILLRKCLVGVFAPALAVVLTASSAEADLLEAYELTGKLGTETSDPATFTITGLTEADLARGSSLTPSAASNGFSASNWTTGANAYFVLGFNVQAGYSATVGELDIATRSSATGPGFINVVAVVDGGAPMVLKTLTQGNATYNDAVVSLSSLTVNSSLRVYLEEANTTSANGGTVGTAGTFRVSDYTPDNGVTYDPIQLLGTVTPLTSSVPEPGPVMLAATMGLLALAPALRRRLAAKPA